MELGKEIRKLRKERKMTQKQLAEACSPPIPYTQIQKYEYGERTPKREMLLRIADALNVNPSVLINTELSMQMNVAIDEFTRAISPYFEKAEKLDASILKQADGTDNLVMVDGEPSIECVVAYDVKTGERKIAPNCSRVMNTSLEAINELERILGESDEST